MDKPDAIKNITSGSDHNLFKTIYDTMPSGTIIIDENYIIKSVNQRTCELTGYTKEQLEGQLCDLVCPIGSKSKLCPIWEYKLSGFQGIDTFLKGKGGFKTPIIKSAKRVTLNGEEFIVEIFQDNSLRKIHQTELQKSEEEYRTLFETANDAIVIFRPDDEVILNVNKKACQLYGYSKQELIGKTLKSLSSNVKRGEEEIGLTLAKKENHNFFTKQTTKSGKIIDLEINASILHHNGELAILSINRDITERQIFEKRLLESERKFKKMYENTVIGIALIDLKFNILEANQAYCEMLGYNEKELIGKSLKDITQPEILPENIELQQKLLNGEINHFQLEKSFIHKTGRKIYGILNAILINDNEGKPAYFLGNVLDITKRKANEKMLEELSLRLKLAISSAKIGIWDYNIKENIMIWDNSMYELYGAKKENYLHAFEAWKALVHPEDIKSADEEVKKSIETQSDLDVIFRILKPSGHTAYIKAYAKTIIEKNEAIRMVGVNYDITDQVIKEETISDNLNEKIVLLQEIHHRVKNNMQIIISLLRLQANSLKNPIALNAFQSSQNRIRSMALVHERLYNSENFTEINLEKYIISLANELIHTYSEKPTSIKLTTNISDIALPIDKAIPCGLILNELITNSLKYAFDKSIAKPEISVKFKVNKDLAQLIYEDNGIGLQKIINFEDPDTLGVKLIMVLSKGQLKGKYRYKLDNGFGFAIKFNMH